MAEQVFRSPGFFPREIEQTFRVAAPSGVPAGIVGTAKKGQAFAPVLISSFREFIDKFGEIDGKNFAPVAVKQFLKNGGSVVFVRVLGAGANQTQGDINTTTNRGTVRNAGFIVPTNGNTLNARKQPLGGVTFLAASHSQTDGTNYPVLAEAGVADTANAKFVRAIIFGDYNTRVFIGSFDTTYANIVTGALAHVDSDDRFKIYVSSSAGTAFSNADNIAGLKVFTASLNPNNVNYITKVLNTNPELFDQEKHLLYASFDVDDEVASVRGKTIVAVSGSTATQEDGIALGTAYGKFDTRFRTPTTPFVISQPYSSKEYDLFRIEALSDGAWANDKLKVSIANLKKSNDHSNPAGKFSLLVRDFSDTDESPIVLEAYHNLSLDADSENYICRRVGNKRFVFDFDQVDDTERRLRVDGKYPLISSLIRVIPSDDLENRLIPKDALPCGFRGYELLKTTTNEKDSGGTSRLHGGLNEKYEGPWILPYIPMRRKITKNTIGSNKEKVDKRLHWGVHFQRVSGAATVPNESSEKSGIKSFAKMLGIRELDMVVTGGASDGLANNKFTIDKIDTRVGTTTHLGTGSVDDAAKDFIYKRDKRFTHKSLADILMEPPDSNGDIDVTFNKYSTIAQFNMFMYGGFDGFNILDKNESQLNDKATSTQTGGIAANGYSFSPLNASQAGTDLNNNGVHSYRRAVEALSNPDAVDINLLAIPCIREPLITDYAATKMRDRFDAFYVMDIENFDKSGNRLFSDSTVKSDVRKTVEKFSMRGLNNNFAATYWPDVILEDTATKKRTTVPPSVAAMGAIAFNDRVGQKWFAPAGFNRGAIEDAIDIDVRLNFTDRNEMYDASINPVTKYPREGVVILGQKTLQVSASAFNRVNVRRLLIEVRRAVRSVANRVLFEAHRQETIDKFVGQVTPLLERIQIQAGIEDFKVVFDNTTTTPQDVENNTLRGVIYIVPTKTAEYIDVSFIISQAGVQFE